jgi:glycosyltransferase involved in cell wall biosynthesis
MKKKIGLFLKAQPSDGGSFRYSQAMVEALASLPREEFEVVVVFTNNNWQEKLKYYDLPAKMINIGFWDRAFVKVWRSIGLPISGWRKICYFFHPMAKELIQQNCDLWIFPSQDTWSYQVPVPALVTIYDLMHRYEKRFPEVSENGEYKFREKRYTQICKWAKGILVDSNVGKQQVIESYEVEPGRVHVLPYTSPQFIYDRSLPEGFDFRYNLPEKFIFYPAQFWEHKNHKGIVEAVNVLKEKCPDIKMIFIGSEKNGYKATFDMVQKLGLTKNVHFLGFVPDEDIPAFYRRATGMIMPTFFGPTNIPTLEANALGCPVAVSDVYGMFEQLGDAALYFDPNDVNDIAEKIYIIWTNDKLRQQLIENGYRKSLVWNQEEFGLKLLSIINTCLAAQDYS